MPASGDWLSPAESARLAGLRFPKRRSEVRLARWAAKQAVARALDLGDDAGTLARVEIRAARTGAPVAFVGEEPAPLAVSMTDRADWAVCVVAPAGLAVGCDLELVEPRSDLFVRDWFTPGEQRLVAGADSGDERHLIANLVWSAKESALKVLQTGLRRSTRSVEVDVVEGTGHERWVAARRPGRGGHRVPGLVAALRRLRAHVRRCGRLRPAGVARGPAEARRCEPLPLLATRPRLTPRRRAVRRSPALSGPCPVRARRPGRAATSPPG